MEKQKLIEEVKKLVAAPSCNAELKKVANDYLESVGKENEKEKLDTLLKGAKACMTPIDGCIEFLKSDMGKQIYGDQRDAVLKDAENRKSNGEDICICAACQACKSIVNGNL